MVKYRRLDILKNFLKTCIDKANNNISNISEHAITLHGMSGKKFRHLLNNLCSGPYTRYLEIGLWQGSTFCSAISNNEQNIEYAYGVDNWSEFGGPKQQFLNNYERYKKENYHIINDNCFNIDLKDKKFNIFFYDGDHSFEMTKKCLEYFKKNLDKQFILIIDDWNANHINDAIRVGIAEFGYIVEYEQSYFTIDQHGMPYADPETWWNGCFVTLLKNEDNILC